MPVSFGHVHLVVLRICARIQKEAKWTKGKFGDLSHYTSHHFSRFVLICSKRITDDRVGPLCSWGPFGPTLHHGHRGSPDVPLRRAAGPASSSTAPGTSSSTARRTAAPTARRCRRTRAIRTATSSLTTPRGGATPLPRCAQPLLLLFRSNPPTEGGGFV